MNQYENQSLIKIENVNSKCDTEFYMGKRCALVAGRGREGRGGEGAVRCALLLPPSQRRRMWGKCGERQGELIDDQRLRYSYTTLHCYVTPRK